MRKPSIFSRDYERQMKKRRRKIILISILCIFFVGFLFIKVSMRNINKDTLRNKIQSWIDEGEVAQEEKEEVTDIQENNPPVEEEKPKEPESKTMDFVIRDGVVLKAEYEEANGKVRFKSIKEAPKNIYYTLNPEKSLILTIDENQNMKIFNTNSKEANITKDNYVAPNGEVFTKESVLKTYNGYLWNVEAKFIDNTKVAYISNVPYFGYDLNKYIWVVDLNNVTHKTLWNSKGKEIKLGDVKEKGLEVTIDGNVKYVNANGELIN